MTMTRLKSAILLAGLAAGAATATTQATGGRPAT